MIRGRLKMVALPGNKDKKKAIVGESFKTKKAREKLKKRLTEMDARVTREALHQKSIEIHRWIARHADQRITLQNKEIALFERSQSAADDLPLKVAKVAQRLNKDF